MHDSGLYYYEPTKTSLVFINTVSKNKEGFQETNHERWQSQGDSTNPGIYHFQGSEVGNQKQTYSGPFSRDRRCGQLRIHLGKRGDLSKR